MLSAQRTLRLDHLVDDGGETIEVRLDANGEVGDARFEMNSLPRIEPLLLGRLVVDVPGIVERLCGVCPAAHHLAGVRALEGVVRTPPLTPTAEAMRRLLHHGAILQAHAQRSAHIDSSAARHLDEFARSVVAAAGTDSHFPRCAVLGGVIKPLASTRRDYLVGQVGHALGEAAAVLSKVESRQRDEARGSPYSGHNLALVNAAGALDLYGERLRAVSSGGAVTIAGARADEWTDLVAESCPGRPASRPYLRELGSDLGGYRVGPTAQLRAAATIDTPLAEGARRRWATADGDSTWARAVMMVHVVEAIEELLDRPELVLGPVLVETGTLGAGPNEASGWVDGARGLLVHTYSADDAGRLTGATITTPTAQNESWLAEMLHTQLRGQLMADLKEDLPAGLTSALEDAIREADPCLPCTSLPKGGMRLRVRAGFVEATRAPGSRG